MKFFLLNLCALASVLSAATSLANAAPAAPQGGGPSNGNSPALTSLHGDPCSLYPTGCCANPQIGEACYEVFDLSEVSGLEVAKLNGYTTHEYTALGKQIFPVLEKYKFFKRKTDNFSAEMAPMDATAGDVIVADSDLKPWCDSLMGLHIKYNGKEIMQIPMVIGTGYTSSEDTCGIDLGKIHVYSPCDDGPVTCSDGNLYY